MTAKASSATSGSLLPRIEGRIQVIRGVRLMIDADLAELYGVPTKGLNRPLRRMTAVVGHFAARARFHHKGGRGG